MSEVIKKTGSRAEALLAATVEVFEEALPGGAALATAKSREVAEVRPQGSTKRHQSGSTALLY
jgi:hypothetical protein